MPLLFSRREMLSAVAALPIAGCALDSAGAPAAPPLNPPFDHALVLNVVELKDVSGTPLHPFTVEVLFSASIPYLGVRTRVHTFTSQDWVYPGPDAFIPFKVTDDQIIALAEQGLVRCSVKFLYGLEVLWEEDDSKRLKDAGKPAPEFTLSVDDNNKYVVT